MRVGEALAARRGERGLTIGQVSTATLIRADQLVALEEGDVARFAAPVYALGHLRTYAAYLGLDGDLLAARLAVENPLVRPGLAVGRAPARPRFVITTSAAGALGLVMLAAAFSAYAWRQMTAPARPLVVAAEPASSASPQLAMPTGPAANAGKPVVVGVRVTEMAWINVVVDGAPQYGSSGRTLAAGSVVYFTGTRVQISSANAAATFVTVDGRGTGAMGAGLATRDYTSQTSTQ